MAVNGVTLRYIVYDILRDLKQRMPDANVSEYQLTYWVLVHADRLLKQHIQKLDSGEYVHKFIINLEIDSNLRMYITLPSRIYDYDLDRGIAYIALATGVSAAGFLTVTCSRTTAAGSKRLYYRTEEVPSITNPYFYREGNKVYLLGVSTIVNMTGAIEVGLYSTLDPTSLTLDIDQYFDFPQDLVPVLKRQVLDLGAWAIMVPKDMSNDGANIQGDIPQKKFVGVNDMSTDEQRALNARTRQQYNETY